MKKKCLLVLLALVPLFASAQFKSTQNGFISVLDQKEYYIAEIQGRSATDLYKSAMAYILSKYQNPDVVASKLENEVINMHVFITDAFPCKKYLGVHNAEVDMNLVMSFKDNKIKFDTPSIHSMVYRLAGEPHEFYFSSLFNRKGEVKNKLAVEGLDNFINKFVGDIINYCGKQTNNDW